MAKYVTVLDKKRGIKRQVTTTAYRIMKNRYQIIDGDPDPQRPVAIKKNGDVDANRAESNDLAATTTDQPKQRKKPGPKPKNKQL